MQSKDVFVIIHNEKIKGETKSKQEVIFEACKEANIYEYDAVSGTIEAGILGFNYFDGIEKVYRKTKYDPFYDPVTKKRKRTRFYHSGKSGSFLRFVKVFFNNSAVC